LGTLPSLIAQFVNSTPVESIDRFCSLLLDWNESDPIYSKVKTLNGISNPYTKTQVNLILENWMTGHSLINSSSLAMMITTAFETTKIAKHPMLDLVWTGCESSTIPFRRTDQTLLEVINSAKESLLVVSFAVYKASSVINAISEAIHRGVRTTIILETDSGENGKVSIAGIDSFTKNEFRLANFYSWPIDQRPIDSQGHYGSLHAKLAVSDEKRLFITSANLTDYAMELNMEMGILINDGDLARQVSIHFSELINQDVLRLVKDYRNKH
jgi:phosphatidylserine/phosphatidylglycerophosphate/cardiolipin synthase-like enzyme